ncbi:MAG TPA: PEP-CTERM sorting domain-containing protein [Vicinamibacterales bacterium]|nr:PEP-CTERM sorting domain-containing protein [Vicinamibacterales bacterium]
MSPGNAWLLQSARYDIVPEPAAVWLLLTGLTGIGGRRLLRRTI